MLKAEYCIFYRRIRHFASDARNAAMPTSMRRIVRSAAEVCGVEEGLSERIFAACFDPRQEPNRHLLEVNEKIDGILSARHPAYA